MVLGLAGLQKVIGQSTWPYHLSPYSAAHVHCSAVDFKATVGLIFPSSRVFLAWPRADEFIVLHKAISA